MPPKPAAIGNSRDPATEAICKMTVTVEQLRREAALPRTNISETAKGLVDFMEANIHEDPLVPGNLEKLSHNPFQDKKACTLL